MELSNVSDQDEECRRREQDCQAKTGQGYQLLHSNLKSADAVSRIARQRRAKGTSSSTPT
jgi:hypothetical protein